MFRNWEFDTTTNRTRFEIHDVDLAIVNGIRRAAIAEVKTLAFRGEPMDEATINITTNTGPLHNDFMVHRIGLIPIHFTSEEIDMEATLEKKFHLHVKNNSEDMVNVTTHDIKVEGEGMSKEHLRLFPANPLTKTPILITRLRKGEELEFTAQVVKSNGKELASFSPVSMCTFSFMTDKTRTADKTLGKLDQERAFTRNQYGEPTSYNFSMEVENGLSAKYVFDKALTILSDKIAMVLAEIVNDDSTKVSVKAVKNGPVTENDNANANKGGGYITDDTDGGAVDDTGTPLVKGIEITFNNEDDTLGNLLQSLIHNEHIRSRSGGAKDKKATAVVVDAVDDDDDSETPSKPISYVGYLCPHPLEPRMLLTLRGKPSHKQTYINHVIASCSQIQGVLNGIRESWAVFAK